MGINTGRRAFTAPQSMRGLSLIELMIAMVLGLFLTAGIITVFLESKRNFSAEDEMARLQENGRYALNILKRELTHAGFFAGIVQANNIDPSTVTAGSACETWGINVTYPVEVIDGITAKPSNTDLTACGVAATMKDGFSIKRSAGDTTLKDGTANLKASGDAGLFIRIKDYGKDKEFYRKGSSGLTAASFKTGDMASETKADYWEYYAKIFYIDDSTDIPSLFVKELNSAGTAMVTNALAEGIEKMRIEFGLADASGAPSEFKSGPLTAVEAASIVAARIYLLVRSVNTIQGHTDTKTYKLGSTVIDPDPNDGFARRVYSTTVQMRNAALPAD